MNDVIIMTFVPPILVAIVAFVAGAVLAICVGAQNRAARRELAAAQEAAEAEAVPAE